MPYRNPDDRAACDEVTQDLDIQGIDVAVVVGHVTERGPGHQQEDQEDGRGQPLPADYPVEPGEPG